MRHCEEDRHELAHCPLVPKELDSKQCPLVGISISMYLVFVFSIYPVQLLTIVSFSFFVKSSFIYR